MKSRLMSILRLRVWPLFILPNLLFFLIALPTNDLWLLNVENTVLLSLSLGVCVAYAPAIYGILFTAQPIRRHDILALGIWCSWYANIIARLWSIGWRYLGMTPSTAFNDVVNYYVFAYIGAAVFHLAAPGGVAGTVPTRRWVAIGCWIAAMVCATVLMMDLWR